MKHLQRRRGELKEEPIVFLGGGFLYTKQTSFAAKSEYINKNRSQSHAVIFSTQREH